MTDDQDIKSKVKLAPAQETGKSHQLISVEHIKSIYIVEGVSAKEIADRFFFTESQIQKIIDDNDLEKLRAAHIKHGLAKLQNMQITQADKLMQLELDYKRLRIIQLEKMLEQYVAYYQRHGHFNKIHPVTGDVLKDTNGLPITLNIPNVTKEIMALKESISLSDGLKHLLSQIDDIINKPKDAERLNPDVIDMASIGNLFQQKKREVEEDD